MKVLELYPTSRFEAIWRGILYGAMLGILLRWIMGMSPIPHL
jgi:hypothetical protein